MLKAEPPGMGGRQPKRRLHPRVVGSRRIRQSLRKRIGQAQGGLVQRRQEHQAPGPGTWILGHFLNHVQIGLIGIDSVAASQHGGVSEPIRNPQPGQNGGSPVPFDQGEAGFETAGFGSRRIRVQEQGKQAPLIHVEIRHEAPLVPPGEPKLVSQSQREGQPGPDPPYVLEVEIEAVLVEVSAEVLAAQLGAHRMSQEKVGKRVSRIPAEKLEPGTALHHIEVVVLPEFDPSSQGVVAAGPGDVVLDLPVPQVGVPHGPRVSDSAVTLDDDRGNAAAVGLAFQQLRNAEARRDLRLELGRTGDVGAEKTSGCSPR